MITNNVLKDTRGKRFASQKALVESLGCRLLHTLESAALCTTSFIATQISLYNDNPLTCMRCEEEVEGVQMVVGEFSSTGLCLYGDDWDHEYFGAGAVSEVL